MYLLGQFKSLYYNNSCILVLLIAQKLAGWNLFCLVHVAPGANGSIDLRYIADPLKAVSGLRLVS